MRIERFERVPCQCRSGVLPTLSCGHVSSRVQSFSLSEDRGRYSVVGVGKSVGDFRRTTLNHWRNTGTSRKSSVLKRRRRTPSVTPVTTLLRTRKSTCHCSVCPSWSLSRVDPSDTRVSDGPATYGLHTGEESSRVVLWRSPVTRHDVKSKYMKDVQVENENSFTVFIIMLFRILFVVPEDGGGECGLGLKGLSWRKTRKVSTIKVQKFIIRIGRYTTKIFKSIIGRVTTSFLPGTWPSQP